MKKGIVSFLFLTLMSVCVFSAQIRVTWDVPPDSSITGYIVRYGSQSTNKAVQFDAGNTNLVTITSIPDNQTIYMDVLSYNAIGLRSVPSPEIKFSTVPPLAPAALRITNGPTVITLQVTNP